MEAKISKEKSDAFDFIVKSMRSAVKNSVLYAPCHPVFDSAVKNLKNSFDKWFVSEDSLNLGISPNNLLLDGNYVKEKDEFYSELAGYLYPRGLIAVSFFKDIQTEELVEFLKVMKEDIKTIRGKGAAKELSSLTHIKVKEINYSFILSEGKKAATEKEIWQTFLETMKDAGKSRLPESKFEFLAGFLKSPQKSALLLNKIYKQTLENIGGGAAADDIVNAVGRMYKYFKENSQEDREFKKGILNVVIHLDAELAVRLFDEKMLDGRDFDLAQEILKDFPDEFVSDFIISLIGEEGSVNENLLKVFDNFTYDKSKAENIVPVVADTLLKKSALDKEALSKLQLSVKELFKNHPDSNFMSEMYKMTVHSFVDTEINEFVISDKLSPLVEEYIQSAKDEALRKNRMELLMNIVWFEDDARQFEKFAMKMPDAFKESVELKDLGRAKRILELFAENLRPEQVRNAQIMSAAKHAAEEMLGKKAIAAIAALIPLLDDTQLNDAAYIFLKAGNICAQILMDSFTSQKDLSARGKIVYLLSSIEKNMQENIAAQLECFDFSAVKDFMGILNEVDAAKARLLAKKLIYHKEKEVRLLAFEIFEIETEEEKNCAFKLLDREKEEEIIKEIMTVLLKMKDKKVIERLFRQIEKNSRTRNYLLMLVELCGYLRLQDALPYLKEILFRRTFFDTKKNVELRMASAVSIMQLDNDEAVEWIKKGAADKRKTVKRVCNIMLQLKQGGREERAFAAKV